LTLSIPVHHCYGEPLPSTLSSLPYATPDFLSNLVALAKFMRP
jgi:hypothetical protein